MQGFCRQFLNIFPTASNKIATLILLQQKSSLTHRLDQPNEEGALMD